MHNGCNEDAQSRCTMVALKDVQWLHYGCTEVALRVHSRCRVVALRMHNSCIKGCTKQVHKGCIKDA